MASGIMTIIHPVADLAQAKRLYGALAGVEPYMDEPYYVGYQVGEQNIGLDPHGHSKGMTGPVGYWHVEDIRAALARLLDAGAEQVQAVTDVGAGKLIASVRDAGGNVVGILQMPR